MRRGVWWRCAVGLLASAGRAIELPAKCAALHRSAGAPPWRITVVEQAPFVRVRDEAGAPIRDTSRWSGFSIDLLKKIAETCRFTYELQLPRQRAPIGALLPAAAGGGGGGGGGAFAYDFHVNSTANYGAGQNDTWQNRSDMYFAAYYSTTRRMRDGIMTTPVMHTPLRIVTRGRAEVPPWTAFLAAGQSWPWVQQPIGAANNGQLSGFWNWPNA